MPGLRRVLNRAYRRLNDVLGLDGNETAGFIDLSQVFAVHEMGPVVEAERVDLAIWGVELVGALGDNLQSLSLDNPAEWDRLWIESDDDADFPDLDASDVLVTNFGLHTSDPATMSYAQFVRAGRWATGAGGADAYVPITSDLTRDATGLLGALSPAVGDPMYLQTMPYRARPSESPALAWGLSGGPPTLTAIAVGVIAPKGVLPRGP